MDFLWTFGCFIICARADWRDGNPGRETVSLAGFRLQVFHQVAQVLAAFPAGPD